MTRPALDPQAQADRPDRIAARVRDVFADVAGFDIADEDGGTRFLELGMDSLMLTQVALQLQKAFGVKVGFRQLMEDCASVDRLAAMLDAQLPPEPPAAEVPSGDDMQRPAGPLAGSALRAPDSAPAGDAIATRARSLRPLDADGVRLLVARQMRLMEQHLALLARAAATAPAAALLSPGEHP